MSRRHRKGFLAAVLTAALVLPLFGGIRGPRAEAAPRTLTLAMAKSIALANSTSYAKLENEYNLKIASRTQAIKSIQAKRKNMSTFRWSPLLNFHFPEQPDLEEAYNFEFKPIQLQAEIDKVEHSMTDEIIAVYEEVSTLYAEIVIGETTINFDQERLESAQDTLTKNQARLKLGKATKSDVQQMEASVKSLNQRITNYTSTLEANKKKMSKLLGMDVRTGYTFENPFVTADIPRDRLEWLTEYTLDRDQNYYEVAMDALTAETSVRTNNSLMEGHYGKKYMSYISGYVNQVLAGQKVNGTAFKKSYDEFLEAVDEPWQGKKRILFIKIPKEWFKGSLDGIRYVEDEPYALYEAALEYQDALLDKNNSADALAQEVENNYNTLVSTRNTYLASIDDVDEAAAQLEKDRVLNKLGQLTYEEFSGSQEEYESLQNDMLDALATYSQTLYAFDRLTCGGVSAFLEEAQAGYNTAAGGQSYITEEYADGAYYFIEPIIQEQEFRLGVSIPDDFDIEITDFELWCDNVQIGARTRVDETLRHLKLAVDNVDEVKIRLYRDNTFVDDCVIDPDSLSGPLEIVAEYTTVQEETLEIGTYTSVQEANGILTIQLQPNAVEDIQYYRIRTKDGKYLVNDQRIPIRTPFKYLALLENSLKDLEIEFFGKEDAKDYTGHFDTANMKLMKNE